MKLILASNNANKLKEFRSLTADLDIELLSQKEAGCDFEVEENGTTFEENAYLKASAVTAATGFAAVADDSGLCVDALNGEPGIYSARYGLGHDASDQDRYRYLLQKMEGVENRSARFVCCICCTFPDGSVIRSRGECEGEILLSPKGRNGFGYDPVFHPLGLEKSMAELSPEEKNAISHRGKALRAFIEELKKL
ncbi:MAG: RdgB/HAM1 family non-canonical purine NTP pyrophosphatase [Oscillospiraceae bacterium]|nr:RdgB/HAM1 family non-canonical purine NTP pyrophosphatase [Oscillospiraceae bacterium]MBO7729199.1 RdgB/HAM1 family non-canonical purine NTP pyrophosphatase [Oscillospiraceae bacterium]